MFVMTPVYQVHCCHLIQKLLLCGTTASLSAAASLLCDAVRANNGCSWLSVVTSSHLSPSVKTCYLQSRHLQSHGVAFAAVPPKSHVVTFTVLSPTVTSRGLYSSVFYNKITPPSQSWHLQSHGNALSVVRSTVSSRGLYSLITFSNVASCFKSRYV